jgi:hypothetical protein
LLFVVFGLFLTLFDLFSAQPFLQFPNFDFKTFCVSTVGIHGHGDDKKMQLKNSDDLEKKS